MLAREVRNLENENAVLKELVTALRTSFNEESPKPKACDCCKYYIQHYVKINGEYKKTYCGHCTHGRIKDRKPNDTCKYFELGTYDSKLL